MGTRSLAFDDTAQPQEGTDSIDDEVNAASKVKAMVHDEVSQIQGKAQAEKKRLEVLSNKVEGAADLPCVMGVLSRALLAN